MMMLGALPRAGSTLLTNILNQNPNLHPSSTSPLLELVWGVNRAYTASSNVIASLEYQDQRSKLYKATAGLIHEWIGDGGIDKNRAWLGELDLLDKLVGRKWRIIAPIRTLEGLVGSLETRRANYPEMFTEYSKDPIERVNQYLNIEFIKASLANIKQASDLARPKNILWVRFEDLTTNPDDSFQEIYRFLGMETFDHDFKNIKQTLFEHDPVHMPFGDHTIVQGGVQPFTKPNITQEVSDLLRITYPWYYERFYG